jgi:hypothetical protein
MLLVHPLAEDGKEASMNTKGWLGVVCVAWMVAACASGGGDDTGSGAGAATVGGGGASNPPAATATPPPAGTAAPPAAKQLKDEITACQAVEKKAEDAESTFDMVEAEAAVQDCYSTAVDGHAAEIDAIRKANGGMQLAPADKTAKQAFDDYRANKGSGPAPTALCDIGHASSSNFGGTLQRVEDAGCAAAIEIRLAKLVAFTTTLPGNPVALDAPDATAADLQAFVGPLVKAMNDNTPGDVAQYTAQVQATLAGVVEASGALCAVLEDAGEMGGGTGAQQLIVGCQAKALGLIKVELTDWTDSGSGEISSTPNAN